MGRPRKEVATLAAEPAAIEAPKLCKCGQPTLTRRDAFFAAAMAGLIARGGTSMDNLIRTAGQYADEAEKAAGGV